MKKKQLNEHQLDRIQRRQDKRVTAADRGDTAVGGPQRRGLVLSHFGQQLDVEALDGPDQGTVVRCHQRSNLDPLVAGDTVIWQQGETANVVVAGLPRRSVLRRPNMLGELKPVAANIDTLVVVIAPAPEAHRNLIDRYLVAAENHGLRPLIVLNKSDLLDPQESPLLELLKSYAALSYPTLLVSSRSRAGLAQLEERLAPGTSIFVGQSGVGKSALVNALLPGVNTLEGSLSEGVTKGRHTTTAARLFHFPGGGNLIDSPGIREFGLTHLEPEELLRGFIEFRPFLDGCRFRDCKHEHEPGCRLREAVAQGRIDPQRLASYQSIRSSLEH
jgi:ribosome biogenesis GTPase